MTRKRQVAVIGAGVVAQDSELAGLAEEVGQLLAEAGATVVCGGREGVMEAVSRGAAAAGGEVIGIVPGHSIEEANPFCTHVVASGVGHARNLAVVGSGAVVIAIGGEWGTLSEIGHARSLGRTVVALRRLGAKRPRADAGRPRCRPRRDARAGRRRCARGALAPRLACCRLLWHIAPQKTTATIRRLVRPELAQGENREGVGPGERGRRGRYTGAGVDALRQSAGRGGAAAQGAEQAQRLAALA